ncbi:ParB/RepB/Spo0J family partition protein [Stakelama tenebrarum]|uniref:ParB/RepB/Spo0J family partition protein n=1 Tax=Stakelama tenebrarum TaxID=2711215 RepID=A0A6G6Y1H2_9SPHN|nr:ParB/RepB/Spo0J family partition protein [Sphingosinithalassobacter tenebrarum]QIG78568.1 ParB/RepB/Spo0J family partition protein [Sphingosinithalassobacter tenebrarum]
MAKAAPKIVLSPSRDIPFDKLILSQSNVRRVKNGVTIENLADSIARRSLLHGLNVRPQLDEDGNETGFFEVPAGGRRYSALATLVKRKRMAKDALVPCVVKAANDPVLAEEDSLAENSEREPLHPLDEFHGMKVLIDKGECEEAIAAHFRVTPAVVRQRLKLASVSPKLHEVYVAGDMTLDQLMAFTVSDDHARQEQLWKQLDHSINRSPSFIRDKLTEDMVSVSDARVRFVGLDAYLSAGGVAPMRDLFEPDDGGWLSDPALLDRLVAEKLDAEADKIKAEGWKWVEALVDLPYGYDEDCRAIEAIQEPPTEADEARIAELRAEADALEDEWAGKGDIPGEVDARVSAIDVELATLSRGRFTYDAQEQARAGVFVGLEADGTLYIDRGYVRPEDEPAEETDDTAEDEGASVSEVSGDEPGGGALQPVAPVSDGTADPASSASGDDDDDDVIKPLPDRLVAELTATRTVALQDAFAQNPAVAFAAVLHAMVLTTFYQVRTESCLELSVSRVYFPFQAPGLRESAAARAMDERHAGWKARLPKSDKDAWDAIQQLDGADQAALFAHCAAYAVNAQWEPVPKHGGGRISAHGVARRIQHANVVARAVGFDMVATGWRPTVENYLGRVTKPRILEAVAEGTEPQKAGLIDHLKKGDMAREAERLLADAGWLPEPLRMPDAEPVLPVAQTAGDEDGEALPAFLGEDDDDEDEQDSAYAVAAE